MKSSQIVDRFGRAIESTNVPLKKKAYGLFGNIFEAPNASRFRPRYYVNQDTEISTNFIVRDLQVRWSREMTRQMPFIHAAIRILALNAVGSAYDPIYTGNNSAWGKQATDWLKQVFYPNSCKRGRNYDFKTMLFLQSQMIDIDGDFLQLYVNGRDGNPVVQVIPCHRIQSTGGANNTQNMMVPSMYSFPSPIPGPIENSISADGVIYDMYGEPLGYEVVNSENLVNTMFGLNKSQFVSAKHSHLIFDPLFIDKGRGLPSISSGILQALSLQEIQAYLIEKLKIESMVALIERTPEGVGAYEESQAYQNFLSAGSTNVNGTGNIASPSNLLYGMTGAFGQTADSGLRVVNTPSIRYISADGEVKTLSSNTPANETTAYISNLESQILQCIGVPHALLFSHDAVSGRISDGIIDTFVSSIKRRQDILDKNAKFICSWAVSKAIANGDLPPNDDENISTLFDFTHPPIPDLNKGYSRKADLDDLGAGVKSINDVVKKYNKTAAEVIKERSEETKLFFMEANKIASETGVDVANVIAYMKNDIKLNVTNNTQQDSTDNKQGE